MVAFSIFGFSIYRYGIFYAISFILGYFWLSRIGRKKRFENYPLVQYFLTDGLEDLIFSIAIGVIFGGRLGHAFIYNPEYYFKHRIEIFQIWKGGMSFIGGILGVILCVGILIFSKKAKRKDVLTLFDLVLVFVPLGIFLGRFGNYLNQELYGVPIATLSSWFGSLLGNLGLSHVYPDIDNILRANTNFLSMIFEGLFLLILQTILFIKMVNKKTFYIGKLSTNFLFFYSAIRFFLEYLRADSQLEYLGIFTRSQWFFLIFIIIALVIRTYLYKSRKKQNLSISLS